MAGTAAVKGGTDFIARLEAANLHPLWDRFRTLTPVKPQAKDPPLIWRWKDIEALANESSAAVAIDDVERRALILVNPAFGGETVTTSNLIAAFTVLDPGDRARPHRHTFAAIRFATRAEGAATIVNGRRCAMRQGDLILTPPMCWHGHINESDCRIVWFDAANIPLIRRLLAALPAGPDGAHTLRYTNPATGDAVMPALDCYAVRLPKGQTTRPKRTTCNMICLVVSGSGRSTVGEHTFDWSQHDVFSVPHWNFVSHTAKDGEASLFIVSDKSAFERLELLQEELQ
jgi:gentisate 1,2-dioxygenase